MRIQENLRITLAQVELVWQNPKQNRQNFEVQIMQLSGKSDLVIFPETFTTGFAMNSPESAESMDGPTINWMKKLSQKSGMALAGSLLINDNNLCYNRFVFITPLGEISCYDKRHLFSIGGESNLLTSGTNRQIVCYLGWRIGLYICYDIRFPVWCRNIDDTDLIIFTANWPDSRQQVWETLLKARAIENQVYVAGVNRIGTDGEVIYYSGGSQVINPKGEVLSPMSVTGDHLFSYEISIQELNHFRKKFPVGNDADQFIIK